MLAPAEDMTKLDTAAGAVEGCVQKAQLTLTITQRFGIHLFCHKSAPSSIYPMRHILWGNIPSLSCAPKKKRRNFFKVIKSAREFDQFYIINWKKQEELQRSCVSCLRVLLNQYISGGKLEMTA